MPAYILTYFQKHQSIIEENLLLCRDPEDVEAIHNFRLSVKRLRVLARLSDLMSDDVFDAKGSLREINKLFKRSGRLRDLQVTGQLMIDQQYEGLDPVIKLFDRRIAGQRVKFEKALDVFGKESLDEFERKLKELLQNVSEKQAIACGHILLASLESDIHLLFHGSTKEKRLHNIRTKLKDVIYLSNIFDERLPVQEYIHISIERLRELGELAGAWHDSLNLEVNLEKYLRKHPDTGNINSLQEFMQELKVKKQGLSQEYVCILMNEMKV